MGRDVLKFRTLEDLLPMAGKAAKRLVVVPPRKRVGAYVLGAVRAPFIKILQYRKADWPDRLSFLGVVEAERAAGAVNFGPSNFDDLAAPRSEEHTSDLQSLMRISYAAFCLHKTNTTTQQYTSRHTSNDTNS